MLGVWGSPAAGAGAALERADDVRGDPAAVEPTGLGDDALAVDEARVHASGVERDVVAQPARTPRSASRTPTPRPPRPGRRRAPRSSGRVPSTRRTKQLRSPPARRARRRRAGSSSSAGGSSPARGRRAWCRPRSRRRARRRGARWSARVAAVVGTPMPTPARARPDQARAGWRSALLDCTGTTGAASRRCRRPRTRRRAPSRAGSGRRRPSGCRRRRR